MKEAELYKAMYLKLFNAVSDGLAALDQGWNEAARLLLMHGQQECEDMYITQGTAGREDALRERGEA